MAPQTTLIPIYTSRGDFGAILVYPYIYNRQGEWIGWSTPDRKVYSVHGQYVGFLAEGPRILRKQADAFDQPRLKPPSRPPRIRPPANAPLPPMMSELSMGVLDVLDDALDLMPTPDTGEALEDMD